MNASSDNDEQDRELIKLLKELGSLEAEYPSDLFENTRNAFVAKVQQQIAKNNGRLSAKKPFVQHLKDLSPVMVEYPPELLAPRRAAFLEQIDQLSVVEAGEEFAPEDGQIIKLLGALKSAEVEYPADLLAARRSALLQQAQSVKNISLLDKLRASVQNLFQEKLTIPPLPLPNVMRTSLVVASLLVAAVITFLLFSRAGPSLKPSPPQAAAGPTGALPTGTDHLVTLLCQPGDASPPCPPLELDPSHDLADQANGEARPAVSNATSSGSEGAHAAAYVNDGRSGASWVSQSPYSWIKIDLGKVTTINSVSLQKGSLGPSQNNNPGQFVIAVALSDVYSDGNSSNDYAEYAPVFNSEQTGFSGTISDAATIRTLFPPVKARYVKITFQKAGAAIDEVGVFMVPTPAPTQPPTKKPRQDVPAATATLVPTNAPAATETATSVILIPTDTEFPTDTPSAIPTDTLLPSPTDTLPLSDSPTPPPTDTLPLSDSPTPLPTDTLPPPDTATSVPTEALPSDTPIPPPTAVPLTTELPLAGTGPLVISGNDQTLTFTCNGNAVELRGHANTLTLLGSCSSITVVGNGNTIFWQFGSPVITNKGTANLITQETLTVP